MIVANFLVITILPRYVESWHDCKNKSSKLMRTICFQFTTT